MPTRGGVGTREEGRLYQYASGDMADGAKGVVFTPPSSIINMLIGTYMIMITDPSEPQEGHCLPPVGVAGTAAGEQGTQTSQEKGTSAAKPNHKEVGEASWYGPGFHGKETANGETFNQNIDDGRPSEFAVGDQSRSNKPREWQESRSTDQ